jgi:UDP-N-acetylglucosamine diphosphorylase/glucosamine-1-phosphate N-acetyltransferase
MKLILSDDNAHLKFAPLTLTRALCELRMGLFTASERWRLLSGELTQEVDTDNPYLINAIDKPSRSDEKVMINSRVIPTKALVDEILALQPNQELYYHNTWIAKRGKNGTLLECANPPVAVLENRWDLYLQNDVVLKSDFEFFTKYSTSGILSNTNTVIGDPSMIFLEAGAVIEASILNTTSGPIYLGKNSEIMEGCMIRGPFSLAEGAVVKMGAKIYGATSIGPYCKVGGEISNSIFLAYSNKGHDGFIGNAYIGAWCNLGADTNCSNLKNNYGHVKTYCFETKKMIQTDVTFMGVFMGDHSKCSINTMFNTATVVGVSANVFSSGFPAKMIESFSWGPDMEKFQFDKAVEVSESMMKRRGLSLSASEKVILEEIFKNS